MKHAKTIEEFFLKRIAKPDPHGCIEWLGDTSHNGYGQFHYQGKNYRAHVFAWEQVNGPVSTGLVLDHLCRNRKCTNVDHLEEVTIKENILRGKGIAAVNAGKLFCKRGHRFTDENTYIYPSGNRECRECRRTIHFKKRKIKCV